MIEQYREKNTLLSEEKIQLVLNSNSESFPLSIVLPAHNEAATIKEVVMNYFHEIVTKVPSKLVVAEDGSVDDTPEILASLANEIPIIVYSGRARKGYAKGVGDALKKCNEEWVFFSDSDRQYFPFDFWKLWEKRNQFDMIVGYKIHRAEGIHRIVMSRVFHILINRLFGLKLKDGDCGFRLIRKQVIDSVITDTNVLKYSFWTEFTVRACLKGFKVHEVPINHVNRKHSETRIYTPSKLPIIIFTQVIGLATLFSKVKKNN
jgi:glycosyltransferase involved in cell wall biosynthesis